MAVLALVDSECQALTVDSLSNFSRKINPFGGENDVKFLVLGLGTAKNGEKGENDEIWIGGGIHFR